MKNKKKKTAWQLCSSASSQQPTAKARQLKYLLLLVNNLIFIL